MEPSKTHYEVLGVAADASTEELKKAHRGAMRIYHPDVYDGDLEEAASMAAQINEAYSVLSNAESRQKYDDSLLAPQQPAPVDPDDYEDTWGQEESWDTDASDPFASDSEGNEAPVSTDPEPEFTQDHTTPPSVRFITPMTVVMLPLIVMLVVAITGVVTSLSMGVRSNTALVVVAASVALGAVGYFTYARRKPQAEGGTKSLATASWFGVALAPVAVIVTRFMDFTSAVQNIGLAAAGGALLGAAYTLFYAGVLQSALNKRVGIASLKKNNVFGGLPGGVGADLLERTLSAFYDVRSMRFARNSRDDALFSHALVNGNRVAFVKGVVGASGLYRWSGPSLLLDRSGKMGQGVPEEVLRATYQDFITRAGKRLPAGVEIDSWLFIYTPNGAQIISSASAPVNGNPRVTSPEVGMKQVAGFLQDGENVPTVNQETFVRAFETLLT